MSQDKSFFIVLVKLRNYVTQDVRVVQATDLDEAWNKAKKFYRERGEHIVSREVFLTEPL